MFVATTMKYSQTNGTNVYTAERIIHFARRTHFLIVLFFSYFYFLRNIINNLCNWNHTIVEPNTDRENMRLQLVVSVAYTLVAHTFIVASACTTTEKISRPTRGDKFLDLSPQPLRCYRWLCACVYCSSHVRVNKTIWTPFHFARDAC